MMSVYAYYRETCPSGEAGGRKGCSAAKGKKEHASSSTIPNVSEKTQRTPSGENYRTGRGQERGGTGNRAKPRCKSAVYKDPFKPNGMVIGAVGGGGESKGCGEDAPQAGVGVVMDMILEGPRDGKASQKRMVHRNILRSKRSKVGNSAPWKQKEVSEKM